jgi:hypothetical protein
LGKHEQKEKKMHAGYAKKKAWKKYKREIPTLGEG